MTAKSSGARSIAFIILAIVVLYPLNLYSQCYLSQGCAPEDNLTYEPNGTGQVYHGDGAANNGAGGWTTRYSDVNQCLSCHFGTDTLPYLMTGHKNSLRKIAPTVLWSGPDGAGYSTNDGYYGSGSTFNWNNGQVTLGWCNPLGTPAQNGLNSTDQACQYPYYTLPNSHAPAAYTPVAPTVAAGGLRNLFYLYGGWENYGGTANPAGTHLNSVFDSGFSGDLYPKGNFDCGRCHSTGYNFDQSAPEPTSNANDRVTWIPDAQFSRIPTDGFAASGTNGTSSWFLTGIQCERCHVAAWTSGSHPEGGLQATIRQNEAATALCIECHREESITMANPTANPPVTGSISPANTMKTLDHGYCSDPSGASYSTCLANSSKWIYKPYVDHEAGQAFLNSPHARFNGTLIQNAQHSSDLSVTISGTYGSDFSESLGDPTKNLGCTGCHDPHQSTVAAANAPKPIATRCDQCHALSSNIMSTVNHPMGPGTPFPTGTSADIPGACITCHMQAALGRAGSHMFRISTDPNYRTFPTPDQLYNQGISSLSTAPEFSALDGTTFTPAAWQDVDLACGQCHVGNDGQTNSYGLTLPPGMPGAHAYTKSQLAYWASVMHAPDPGVPTPTFSPSPTTTYHSPQVVTISDSMTGATIYYSTDGSTPTKSSLVYSTPITILTTTTIHALATHAGIPQSNVASATYSIVLPTAPAPTFSPTPSTFSTPQSVKLSNTLNLPMYYTTDGSTPTAASTPYSVPIVVSQNTTINAITAAYAYLTSSVSSGTYLIQAPLPTFSPSSGTYYTTQTVTISDAVSGATIYYTTNGTGPTTSSTSCSNPCKLPVSATTTFKAIASGGGFTASNVAVATYTIAASNPTFSPGAGTYYSTPVSVTISDATSGVTIYYTTDGSFPSTSSPSCSSPCSLTVSITTTIRAIAAGNGISQSGTSVAVYTIAANTPTFSPGSGTYSSAQNVTISDKTSGVTIYYTTDGSFPSTSSPSCSNPCSITVSTTSVVRAMAAGNGIAQSGVAVASYTITGH